MTCLMNFKNGSRIRSSNGSGRTFVDAKLEERDERHRRMGDTRYVVEPNLKEGKGGLRDLQTLYWIGKIYLRRGTLARPGAAPCDHRRRCQAV